MRIMCTYVQVGSYDLPSVSLATQHLTTLTTSANTDGSASSDIDDSDGNADGSLDDAASRGSSSMQTSLVASLRNDFEPPLTAHAKPHTASRLVIPVASLRAWLFANR